MYSINKCLDFLEMGGGLKREQMSINYCVALFMIWVYLKSNKYSWKVCSIFLGFVLKWIIIYAFKVPYCLFIQYSNHHKALESKIQKCSRQHTLWWRIKRKNHEKICKKKWSEKITKKKKQNYEKNGYRAKLEPNI